VHRLGPRRLPPLVDRSLFAASSLALLVGASCPSDAAAGTLRGQLSVSADRADPAPDGLWRIENGILPIAPRTADPRTECVVVLEPKAAGKSKELGKPETVSATLRGMRLVPTAIVVPLGGSIEIKNEDRLPHALGVAGADADVFPARPTPAGATRTERPQRPGVFALRDEESPHVRGWLIVTDTAVAVRPDEHWAYKLEAPDGQYTLRVLYKGSVAIERAVEIGPKSGELNLTIPAVMR
jgi:hypothetical protein